MCSIKSVESTFESVPHCGLLINVKDVFLGGGEYSFISESELAYEIKIKCSEYT